MAHDGGSSRGQFLQTLTLTDVATGWTLVRAVLNKAQKWVFAALQFLVSLLPFALKGLNDRLGRRVHQPQSAYLVSAQSCGLHQKPRLPQKRQPLRRTEEQRRGAHCRGLPALRHPGAVTATQPTLCPAVPVGELLLSLHEAGGEGPRGRTCAKALRHSTHPLPESAGLHPDPKEATRKSSVLSFSCSILPPSHAQWLHCRPNWRRRRCADNRTLTRNGWP